jgi:coenzyme F420-reducing hydrogenase gamma subunit
LIKFRKELRVNRPKVLITNFSSCGGCLLEIIDLEDKLLDFAEVVHIADFRTAKSDFEPEPYDIAIVEGNVTMKEQIAKVSLVREYSKIVVAFGACACHGNVQFLSNYVGLENAKKMVYGDTKMDYEIVDTKPIDRVIKVDHYLPGCPPNREEILDFIKESVQGKRFSEKTYPVCVECRLRGNFCIFKEDGICLGPITRGGCGAICPTNGWPCSSCWGPVVQANLDWEIQLMRDRKLSNEEMMAKFRKFTSGAKMYEELKL